MSKEKKNPIQYGIEKPKHRNPHACKYPFADMTRKGAAFFQEGASTHALLTSFKAWCSRYKKGWKAQCWSATENGSAGAWIKRIK